MGKDELEMAEETELTEEQARQARLHHFTRRDDENLKYVFSDQELISISKDLAKLTHDRDSLESEKKQMTSNYNSRIQECISKINRISEDISSGFTYRLVRVDVMMNSPEPGRKSIFRADSGEFVREESMTEKDRQLTFDDFKEMKASEERAEAIKATKGPGIFQPPQPPADPADPAPESAGPVTGQEA